MQPLSSGLPAESFMILTSNAEFVKHFFNFFLKKISLLTFFVFMHHLILNCFVIPALQEDWKHAPQERADSRGIDARNL